MFKKIAWISSPSVKIQIVGGKVCLRCKGKPLPGVCFQQFVDITQQCFALLPQVNIPAYNWNFHGSTLLRSGSEWPFDQA